MKCKNCGADIPENQEICSVCGAQAGSEGQTGDKAGSQEEVTAEAPAADAETAQAEALAAEEETAQTEAPAAEIEAAQTEAPAETIVTEAAVPAEPKKNNTKLIIGAVAAVAVVAAGAFGLSKMNEKDPKQTVIDAFESVYPEGQVYPVDELFGITQFADEAGTANSEGSMTLKLDSCSDESVNAYAGSGIRVNGKSDITNKKSSAELAAIYNGMDLVTFKMYYGDDMLKAALPEMSGKVFTLDLGDGLADRISQSPVVGPMLEQNNIDVTGMAEYFTQLIDEAEQNQAEGKSTYDLEGLWNRYKEGSKAQENFKAALTVEKGDKASFTIDGSQESCKGYKVLVSKASMMDFLRTSSDFFLQDEELKDQYMKQLEMTVKMSGFMGGNTAGVTMPSAEEMQQQTYEELQSTVTEMLDTLDAVLDDVTMTVYVDKKGRLAAVDGTTVLHNDTDAEDTINVAFHLELAGGAYLTQNATANVTLTNPADEGDSIALNLVKQGTYDGKQLTADWSLDFVSLPENDKGNLTYTGTYNSESGDYHMAFEVGNGDEQLAKLSVTGVIDSLEKGTSIHATMDSLEISAEGGLYSAVLSGEYEYKPLAGEVTAPEGEEMDVLAATEEDWQNVVMEMIYGAMGLMEQMGVSLY